MKYLTWVRMHLQVFLHLFISFYFYFLTESCHEVQTLLEVVNLLKILKYLNNKKCTNMPWGWYTHTNKSNYSVALGHCSLINYSVVNQKIVLLRRTSIFFLIKCSEGQCWPCCIIWYSNFLLHFYFALTLLNYVHRNLSKPRYMR